MLTEKRQEEIVRLVQERESITVAELKDILQTSESTIRRDITSLDKEGRLTKVFGGAIALRTAQILNQELLKSHIMLIGFRSHRHNVLCLFIVRHHGRLVENNALAPDAYHNVGSAKIYSNIHMTDHLSNNLAIISPAPFGHHFRKL